jgi:hypothetical protein
MTRSFWRGTKAILAVLAAIAFGVTPARAAPPPGVRSAPLAAGNAAYTLTYSFSADPKDNTYVASFTPDTKSIFAWAWVTANNGSAQKQFQVDIQFIAPNGQTATTAWYGSDTGTVTTYPDTQNAPGNGNVARRELDIAGTPNANLAGQWTVNFLANGQLIITGNFSLSGATDLSANDPSQSGRAELEAEGYTVAEVGETQSSDGKQVAYADMKMESSDLYSSRTSQQMVDGFAALRFAYPHADTLVDILAYNDRYDVALYVSGADADAYFRSRDFNTLAQAIGTNIYDKQTGKYLGQGTTDFVNKNFGAGTPQPPPNAPPTKQGAVGSVRVQISPSSLPADGTSTASVLVTVYDKRNQPLPNADVLFALSGSGSGSIRPRETLSDNSGQAQATFTAGTGRGGSLTVTATVSNTIGTGVITLGAGSSDPAADNVVTYLEGRGFKVLYAGFTDSAKTIALVVIDLGTSYDINAVGAPILSGLHALRQFYPTATKLGVAIPYQANYLVFPSSSADFDMFEQNLQAATTDAQKSTVVQNFLNQVFNQASVADSNGNAIGTYKDFVTKNFAK